MEVISDIATIVTGSKFAFFLIVILIFLAYALGKIILIGAFGAIMFGTIGYLLFGETGATIGGAIGLISGIGVALDELKKELNEKK